MLVAWPWTLDQRSALVFLWTAQNANVSNASSWDALRNRPIASPNEVRSRSAIAAKRADPPAMTYRQAPAPPAHMHNSALLDVFGRPIGGPDGGLTKCRANFGRRLEAAAE